MMNFKKYIKEILPDRLFYLYLLLRKFPEYAKTLIDDKDKKYRDVSFFSDQETVDQIVFSHKSMSRFGDGEISWMAGIRLNSFQEYSDELAADLIRVFRSNNPNLLIGIPRGIYDSSKCNLYAKMHWKIIKSNFQTNIERSGNVDRIYCNASITRPYIDYRDREYSKRKFEDLKRIWNKRDVLFVEGEKTKLGMGNDLFTNARSICRIICPAENAYAKLDVIKLSIQKHINKDCLILVSLGPTASILAADMCEIGYQIIDIGHIDIEYIWFLNRSILRDAIPGKYVNESGEKVCTDLYDTNQEYLDSIIDKLC